MTEQETKTGDKQTQDGIPEPSDGKGSQVGRTPQGGGQNNKSPGGGHSGGRDSSQDGGQND